MSGRCLSTYLELPDEGYSATARRRLADGRKLPATLDFTRADFPEIRRATATRMSISGVQEKLSLRLNRGKFEVVGEGGDYILKPIPRIELPRFADEVPANESLTMQLAEQVFGITTAANGLIRLADGELAYLTRRFDRGPGGTRIAQEDFCQLSGRSLERTGRNFKYDGSYEELAQVLKRFCPAYAVEAVKLFRLIVFNYLVGNGDAHLKNFSVQQSPDGDHVLTPAYDLVNTTLHLPNETRCALPLLAGDDVPGGVETHGYETGADFLNLAERMGVPSMSAQSVLENLIAHKEEVDPLIERSFLSTEAKAGYAELVADRRFALSIRE